jgi:hypothetical protein
MTQHAFDTPPVSSNQQRPFRFPQLFCIPSDILIAIMEFDTKTRECDCVCCWRSGTDMTYSSLPDFGQGFVCVHFGARSLACYSCE